jgi:hypothetical protein
MHEKFDKGNGKRCPECSERTLSVGLVQEVMYYDGKKLNSGRVVRNVCSCGYSLVVRDDFPNAPRAPYREDLLNMKRAVDYFSKT